MTQSFDPAVGNPIRLRGTRKGRFGPNSYLRVKEWHEQTHGPQQRAIDFGRGGEEKVKPGGGGGGSASGSSRRAMLPSAGGMRR